MPSLEQRLSALERAAFGGGFRAVIQRLGQSEADALAEAGVPEDYPGLIVFIVRFTWDYSPNLDRLNGVKH